MSLLLIPVGKKFIRIVFVLLSGSPFKVCVAEVRWAFELLP